MWVPPFKLLSNFTDSYEASFESNVIGGHPNMLLTFLSSVIATCLIVNL
jgi:hypothetical protein